MNINLNFAIMKKHFFTTLAVLIASTLFFVTSCEKEEPEDLSVAATITSFSITSPVSVSGEIDTTAGTISLSVPGDEDITNMTVDIQVPEGATVSPASGTSHDFTNPVTFTVTGADADGVEITKTFTASVELTAVIGFIGKTATFGQLEDDAMAAASWMQTVYGDQFIYLGAADITADAIANLKVIFYYELEPIAGTNEIDLGAMTDVALTVSNWVRDGGMLLLAGDAADYIFEIDRIPGALYWNEICCSGVEGDKPADDIWGMSVVPETTSDDRTDHPLWEGILTEDNRVYLNNAPTREVRLFWWNVGPAGGECCGNLDMVTNFEEQYKAIKLSSLRHVGDYFGFNAIEFGRTDLDTHASLNADVPKDFRGTVLMFSNTINGYEWVVNDESVNEYHDNIEALTENAISYLKGLYDAQ
jgi:hypothetical protein